MKVMFYTIVMFQLRDQMRLPHRIPRHRGGPPGVQDREGGEVSPTRARPGGHDDQTCQQKAEHNIQRRRLLAPSPW